MIALENLEHDENGSEYSVPSSEDDLIDRRRPRAKAKGKAKGKPKGRPKAVPKLRGRPRIINEMPRLNEEELVIGEE